MTVPTANILFVCTGNTCRSPFAQAFFTKLIHQKDLDAVAAESAGLTALPGDTATLTAQQAAAEHGVDLAAHQAKPVSKELVSGSDLILVMERSHESAIIANYPESAGKVRLLRHYGRFGSTQRGVTDPYGLQYDAYRFCFLDIEDAVTGLVETLSAQQVSTR